LFRFFFYLVSTFRSRYLTFQFSFFVCVTLVLLHPFIVFRLLPRFYILYSVLDIRVFVLRSRPFISSVYDFARAYHSQNLYLSDRNQWAGDKVHESCITRCHRCVLFQSVVTLVIWLEGSAIVGKNSRKPEVATRRLRNSCTSEVKHTSLKYIAWHEMLYWEYVHDRRPSLWHITLHFWIYVFF
jgi:hypothetical protein